VSEFITSMTYPFLACLLLAGIHVYLGIHVIERKVIFVDLALAQIAALGSVYAILLGYGPEQSPWAHKLISFGMAVLAAPIFAATRTRHDRIPQEAVIGIAYAAAVAASILASANLPHGADELRELLAGSILWVTGDTVASAAVVYFVVGLFHLVFRRQLLSVSLDASAAEDAGINVRLWDFLFYISFAIVVTSSVAIAGVLLVFAFLVVPAVVAVLLSDNIRTRLLIGWGVGALASFSGVTTSYAADLPSGPVIVLALVGALVVVALVRSVVLSDAPAKAAARATGVATVVISLISALVFVRTNVDLEVARSIHDHDAHNRLATIAKAVDSAETWHNLRSHLTELLEDPDPGVRAAAAALIGTRQDERHEQDHLDALHALLADGNDTVQEASVRAIRALHLPQSIEPLLAAATDEDDMFVRTELAEAVVELGDPRGIPILFAVVDLAKPRQVRKEAYEHLFHHIDMTMPAFDEQKRDLSRWWESQRDRLRWDQQRLLYITR